METKKDNCVFPKVPMNILFCDSLLAKRKQKYIDCNGVHLYYKELAFIRKVQKYVDNERDTSRRKDPDYCRVKFNRRAHKECMRIFGYSPTCTDIDFGLMGFQNVAVMP